MRNALTLALLTLAVTTCWAGTYYVAPGGNDAGPGTLEQPWASQQKLTLMRAGDTLMFRAGTYPVGWIGIGTYSGTEDQPIIIKSFPGEQVIWTATSDHPQVFAMVGSWCVLDGIEITGQTGYGVFITQNGSARPCEHNVIRNCKFYDTSDYCDMVKVHGNASMAAKYVTIENCEFWGKCANFIDVTGENVEIRNCYFHDYTRGHQEQVVQIKGGTIGNSVHDNLFLRCENVGNKVDWWSASVVDLGGGMDPGTQRRARACYDTHVYNNLIVGGNNPGVRLRDTVDCTVTNNTIVLSDSVPPNAYGPLAPIIIGSTSERTVLRNNIIVNDRPRMLMVCGRPAGSPSVGSSTLSSDHNLFYYTGKSPSWAWLPPGTPAVDWLTGGDDFPYVRSYLTVTLDSYRSLSGQDAHSIVADPLFADAANGDYTLLPGSPALALGAGAVVGGAAPPPPPPPDPLVAGVVTLGAVTHNSIALSSLPATGGVAPLLYQWERASGAGEWSAVAGATGLTCDDAGLVPLTQYAYRLVVKDAAGVQAVSAVVQVTTLEDPDAWWQATVAAITHRYPDMPAEALSILRGLVDYMGGQ